jgi:histone deacetylase HOS3
LLGLPFRLLRRYGFLWRLGFENANVEQASSQSTIPKLEPSYKQPTKQSARRLSLASNTSSVTTEVPNMKSNIVGRHPSISSTNPIRPPSVSSVRPDSSMSSRGHSIPPVVVKKTRPAASTAKVARAESAKPARAPRKSPVGVGSASEIIPKSRVLSASKSQTTEVANTDIDSLSAGMKKIRVSLVTKAQKEAREQAKTAAGKATTKKTIPIEQLNAPDPAIPAAEAQLAASIPAPVSGISEAPPTAIARPSFTPQPLDPSRFAHLQDATVIPLIRSSPPRPRSPAITSNQNLPSAPTPPTHTYATASTGNSGANVFIPYQPEGPTPLAAVPGRMEELKWLEPNTGTPSPVKKSELEFGKVAKMGIMDVDGTEKHGIEKAQLPVFSATGVIPFGVKVEQKFNESIWDVPETPKK